MEGGPRQRVATYIRVSTAGPQRRASRSYISEQLQEQGAVRFAAERGLEVVASERDIDRTGRTYDREGLDRIISMAAAGDLEGIVVYYASRLGRSLRLSLNVLHELESEHGLTIYSVNERFDRHTTEGRFISHVFISQAEMESDRLGDQWAAARSNASDRGVYLGRVPFGYAKDPATGFVIPHPEHAAIVAELYEGRASGRTLSDLVTILNEQTPLPDGRSHGRARVSEIVKAERYRGASLNLPRLVDDSLWYAAQTPPAVARKADKRRRPEQAHDYFLSGIARCGTCGGAMNGGGSSAQPVYKCGTRVRKGDRPCPAGPSIIASRLEPWVLEHVGRASTGGLDVQEGTDAEHVATLDAERDAADRRLADYASDHVARDILIKASGHNAWHTMLQQFADDAETARRRAAEARRTLEAANEHLSWADVVTDPVRLRAALRSRIKHLAVHPGRGLTVDQRCDLVLRRA